MRKLVFAALFLAAPSFPANAQSLSNQTAASLAGKACVNHLLGKGQQNGFLLNAGFTQRGHTFVRPSTKLGLTGHTDRATIKLKSKACSYWYGSDRSDRAAFEDFAAEFRNADLKEMVRKLKRSQAPAFQIGDIAYTLFGSSGVKNSAFFTSITVSDR